MVQSVPHSGFTGVHHQAVAAYGFGVGELRVYYLQQLGQLQVRWAPDACAAYAHRQLLLAREGGPVGYSHGVDYPLGHQHSAAGVGVRQHQQELIVTVARDVVLGSTRLGEQLAHLLQDHVSRLAAVGVIDPSKLVEVKYEATKGIVGGPGAGQLEVEQFLNGPAVEEAGEVVSEGGGLCSVQRLDVPGGEPDLLVHGGLHVAPRAQLMRYR